MRTRPGDHDAKLVGDEVGAKVGRAGIVGIGVEPDRLALRRRLDHRQRLARAAPVLRPGAFVMRDHDGNVSAPRRLHRLLDRIEHRLHLAPHVRRVDAAVLREARRDARDLVDVGAGVGRIEQPGREAGRAVLHRLLGVVEHRADLRVARLDADVGHGGEAERRMADQRGDVHARDGRRDRARIVGEGRELVRLLASRAGSSAPAGRLRR